MRPPPERRPGRKLGSAERAKEARDLVARMQELHQRLHNAIEDRSLLEIQLRNLLSVSDRPHQHGELHEGLSSERCPFCQARVSAITALGQVRRSGTVGGEVDSPAWRRRRGALRAGMDRLRELGEEDSAHELGLALLDLEPPATDDLQRLLRDWEVGPDA